jgi:hypothetical protein
MNAVIENYLAGLRRRLPAPIAEEAATGLIDTFEHHLRTAAGEQDAARAALAEYGDLATVTGEFTRQAPGRRAARLLLATGPAAGACWAAALVSGHAWAWPVPAAVWPASGAVLLLAILTLAAAATSRRSYRRTRLTMLASPAILALDAAAVAAVLAVAPALTWPLAAAVTLSLARIAFTTAVLPRLATR